MTIGLASLDNRLDVERRTGLAVIGSSRGSDTVRRIGERDERKAPLDVQ